MKNRNKEGFLLNRRNLFKILLAMKFALLFMLLTTLQTFASVYSQSTKLTLDLRNASVSDALKEIEGQSEFKFLYYDALISTEKNLNMRLKDKTLEEILNTLLEGGNNTWSVLENNLVVISNKEVDMQDEITVSGKITAEDTGEPLPGVNITIKGTTLGTITNIEGEFSIVVPDGNAILVFTYVGYLGKEITVGDQTTIDVGLVEDIIGLEELVVVGYGTQRKGDITSAVATVKPEEFIKGGVKDVGQLIQGKVAGLTVYNISGDPTSNVQITLRGANTLGGTGRDPLVIIDGVPGDLNTVSTEDIESIDVLKDGSAAAIYGTRGTNGVIFVTTKRASGLYTNLVEYSAYVTKSTIAKKMDMMTADDYHSMVADGTRDSSYVYDWDVSTDWQDELLQEPWSFVQNLTFRGGNDRTNYLASFSMDNAEGIIIGTENNVYTARADINHNMFKNKLKFNVGVLSRFSKNPNNADGYSLSGFTWRQAIIHNPTEPIKNEDGTWFEDRNKFYYENPLGHIYETDGYNKSNLNRVNGTVTLAPIEGLEIKSLMSYSRYNQTRTYYQSRDHFHGALVDGYGSNGTSETIEKLIELTASYKKSFGKNRFSILGGYGYQERDWFDFWIRNEDFPTDMFGYSNLDIGLGYNEGTTWDSDTRRERTNLIGFFGRANYSFDEKYLVMGSVRYEAGSQLVGADAPWGLFPAVSVGWRISNESFMQNLSFVNDLKLRAGWGITGSLPNRLYNAYETKTYSGTIEINGEDYLILAPQGNRNEDLKWEEKTEINIGLDFVLLNNRLGGSVDLYNRRVDDLLYDFQVPVPPNKVATTYANAGVLQNRGIEVMLNIVPVQTPDFEWQTSFSFSTNKNEIVSLGALGYEAAEKIGIGNAGEPIWGATHKLEVGHPVGDLWAYRVVDIDSNGYWMYEVKYPDVNGNDSATVIVNYDDFSALREDASRQVIGNGIPDFYAGWNNTFRYKNFDLTITQRGAFGHQILNRSRMYYENTGIGANNRYNQLRSAYDPIFGKVPLNEEVPLEYNSYYIEDGDYWKIDNITLGYTFSDLKTPYLKSARIYVSTLNTFVITNYSGVDPEVRITGPQPGSRNFVDDEGLQPGNDARDKYPTIRSYTVGINVTF